MTSSALTTLPFVILSAVAWGSVMVLPFTVPGSAWIESNYNNRNASVGETAARLAGLDTRSALAACQTLMCRAATTYKQYICVGALKRNNDVRHEAAAFYAQRPAQSGGFCTVVLARR